MFNRHGILIVISTILCVGFAATWLDAMPTGALETQPGTLAGAVAAHCAPNRRGTFAGSDLDDAVTCRDLAAQQSMALSTERLVWLSWGQLGVAFGGAVAVVWTVLVALHSMALTRRSLEHQQTATRLSLRPRLQRPVIDVQDRPDGGMNASFRFFNIGGLPAQNVRHRLVWKLAPYEANTCVLREDDLTLPAEKAGSLVPGMALGSRLTINKPAADNIRAGRTALQIGFIAVFDDELGGQYRFSFLAEFTGEKLALDRRMRNVKIRDREYLRRRA